MSHLQLKPLFLPDKWFDNVSDDVAVVLKPLLQKHGVDGGKKKEKDKEG